MGISWKMRFLLVKAFREGLMFHNNRRDEPRDASFVLDRLSEFMEDVQHGTYDHILIYADRNRFDIPVTKERDALWTITHDKINNP
jgi:hypothetical protein